MPSEPESNASPAAREEDELKVIDDHFLMQIPIVNLFFDMLDNAPTPDQLKEIINESEG